MPFPEPAVTGSTDSVTVTSRSTARSTVVLADAESFAALLSDWLTAVTVAVLEIMAFATAEEPAVMTTVSMSEAPFGTPPTVPTSDTDASTATT